MVKVTLDSSCSTAIRAATPAITQWLNIPGNNINSATGESYDEAIIMGGDHYSMSQWDPCKLAHVTVRMTNAALRSRNEFQVLHWRRGNEPKPFAPGVTDEVEHNRRKASRRARKQNVRNQQQQQAGSSSAATATASSSRTPAPPAATKPATQFVPRQVAAAKKPAPAPKKDSPAPKKDSPPPAK